MFADLRVNDPVGCSPLDVRKADGFFRYSWCRSFCSERVAFTLSGRVCIFAVGRSRQLFPGRMDPAKDYSPGDCSISAGNIGSPEFFVFDDKRTGKKPVKQ